MLSAQAGTDGWVATGPAIQNISSLAVSPQGVLYATGPTYSGTSKGGIFKSSDNGANWVEADKGIVRTINPSLLAVDSNGNVYAAGLGIYKTSDGASGWTTMVDPSAGIYVGALAADSSGRMFAAVYKKNAYSILKSTDGGVTWPIISQGMNKFVSSLAIDSMGVLYAAANAEGIFKSVDGGVNWASVNSGLNGARILTVATDAAGNVFATTGSALYKSTNKGASWSAVTFPNPYVGKLAIDSFGKIYAGSGNGVYVSSDGGATWTLLGNSSSSSPSSGSIAVFGAGNVVVGGYSSYASAGCCIHVYTPPSTVLGTPGAPTLTSFTTGISNVTIRFTAPVNTGNAAITGYAATCTAGSTALTASGAASPLIVQGLTAGVNYSCSVMASNSVGAGVSSTATSVSIVAPGSGGKWTATGPAVQNITALVTSPDGTIFAAAPAYSSMSGGVFKSTDNGANWVEADKGIVKSYGASSLAVDSSGNVYAGGLGIYKSTNGGSSWTTAISGAEGVSVNAMIADSAGNIYAAAHVANSYVVLKSTNGGATWPTVSQNLNTYFAAFAIDNKGALYAAARTHGIYKSSDGGVTWAAVNTGLNLADFLSVATDTSGNVYAAANLSYDSKDYGGVFKSTNGGASWAPVTNGSGAYMVALAVDPRGKIYAANISDDVFVSGDGAATWTALGNYSSMSAMVVDSAGNLILGNYSGYSGGAAGCCIQVYTPPSTASSVPGAPMLTSFTTGTSNVTIKFSPPANTGNAAITGYTATCTAGSTALTAGGAASPLVVQGLTAGVNYSCSVRASNSIGAGVASTATSVSIAAPGSVGKWTSVGPAVQNISALAVSPQGVIYAAAPTYYGMKGGVFKSTGNGATWVEADSGIDPTYGASLLAVDPGGNVYASSVGLFKSANGGTSWTALSTGAANYVSAMIADSAGKVYAAARTDTGYVILKSTDGGVTWPTVSKGLNTYLFALAIDSKGNLYGATSDSIFKSSDGGVTWTTVNTGLNAARFLTVVIDAYDNVYVGADSYRSIGGIYKSTNGGASWVNVTNGTSYNIRALAIDPRGKIYAAGDGVYMSTDGAATWTFLGNGTSSISSMAVDSIGNLITGSYVSYGQAGCCIQIYSPPPSVPDAPTLNGIVIDGGNAKISFTAPMYMGSGNFTGYKATCISGSSTLTASGSASPLVVQGLSVGVSYSCSVAASNSVGTSASSSASTVVVPLHVPICTLTASPTQISSGEISVLTTSCSPAATSYAWTNSGFGPTVFAGTVSPKATTTYSVVGSNIAGSGIGASVSVSVKPVTAPVCTLTAVPATVTAGSTSYLLAKCTPEATSYTWTNTNFSAGTSSGGVSPMATTTYSVVGSNSVGSSNNASATVTVSGAATPTQALFVNASTSSNKTSVIRLTNTTGSAGLLTATAFDESGNLLGNANASLGAITANQTLTLSSADLESAMGFTPGAPTAKYAVYFNAALTGLQLINYTKDNATGTLTLGQSLNVDRSSRPTASSVSRVAWFVSASTSANKTSVLRLVNTSTQSGSLSATAYDESGNFLGTANTALGTIVPRQMYSFTSAQLESAMGFVPSSATSKYRVVFTATLPSLELINFTRDIASGNLSLVQTQLEDRPDNASATSTRNALVVYPSTNSTQTTVLRIVNPNSSSGSFAVTVYNEAGSVVGSGTLSIGANQMLALTSSDIESRLRYVPTSAFAQYHLAISANVPTFEVLNHVKLANGNLMLAQAQTDSRPASTASTSTRTAYVVYPSSQTGMATDLRLVNTTSQSATVSVSVYDDSGALIGSNLELGVLQANQALSVSAARIEQLMETKIGVNSRWRVLFSANLSNFEVIDYAKDAASGIPILAQPQTD